MKTKKLILIFGPPAVGKMTVGQVLAKKKDYVLFHNHHSIEMTLELFEHGTNEFDKVNDGIRELVFKTVVESENIKGFIFTFVMAFDIQKDIDYTKNVINMFKKKEWTIYTLELNSDLKTRLKRNKTENRLKHKKSKRDLVFSENNIKKMEEQYIMTSKENVFGNENYLSVDNTNKSAVEVVELIKLKFKL